MKKIIIQAGHQGRTSGSTGAPEEQKWTGEIVPKIAKLVREAGIDVREVNADPSSSELAGDWDLFLAVHYDADVYNDRGGFIDYPEPSTDGATAESQRIAGVMTDVYFPATGIPNKPNRSNKNTRYYYMWSKLSAKTPCVLIEAGVGWRTPEDHQTLHFEQPKVAKAIADGIIRALGGSTPEPSTDTQSGSGNLPSNYPDIVHGSTQWDGVCEYLELGVPKNTTADQAKSKIAGFKSRITDLEKQLNNVLDIKVKAPDNVERTVGYYVAEWFNRNEQVSRLKEQLASCATTEKDLNTNIKNLTNQLKSQATQYEGRISTLETQVEDIARSKGVLATQITTLQNEKQVLQNKVDSLLASSNESLTIGDVIILLWEKIKVLKLK